jgi:epoxyqueuosine reductase
MDSLPIENLTESVKTEALRLGFDACGIASVSPADPEDRLGTWLRREYHAGMEWMVRTQGLRQDVTLKVPEAKSVIVVARNYYTGEAECLEGQGRVARYAWGRDYHSVLLPLVKQLAAFLQTLQPGANSYAEVDTGPVLERVWAARAGVGWIGKNSLLVRRNGGSWFFLGSIITTVELCPDAPLPAYCGQCRACMDACPTHAIVEPHVVDARRCIAYHTIENRGEIPESLHSAMGLWVFGCDLCQEACPWNRFARITSETEFSPRPEIAHPDLDELARMDETGFAQRFADSSVLRAKHAGLQRNAQIAVKNNNMPDI